MRYTDVRRSGLWVVPLFVVATLYDCDVMQEKLSHVHRSLQVLAAQMRIAQGDEQGGFELLQSARAQRRTSLPCDRPRFEMQFASLSGDMAVERQMEAWFDCVGQTVSVVAHASAQQVAGATHELRTELASKQAQLQYVAKAVRKAATKAISRAAIFCDEPALLPTLVPPATRS